MDYVCSLGLTNDQELRSADVKASKQGTTMRVCISAGMNDRIEPALMIFKNKRCYYSMRNVPDIVSRVACWTDRKGWMDSINMIAWLREECVIMPLSNGKTCDLITNNCIGQNLTEDILGAAEAIWNNLHFPPNNMELVQPYGALVMQKDHGSMDKELEQL